MSVGFPSAGDVVAVAICGSGSSTVWRGSKMIPALEAMRLKHGLEQPDAVPMASTLLYGVALIRWQFGLPDCSMLELLAMRVGGHTCKYLEHHVLQSAFLETPVAFKPSGYYWFPSLHITF